MEIKTTASSDNVVRTLREGVSRSTQSDSARVVAVQPASNQHENVNLSAASQLRHVSQASASSGVDMAKVAQIRSAISQGTFEINPGKIADGILGSAASLMKTPAK